MSSSSPSGETITKWNDDLQPYWRDALTRAQTASNQPHQTYDPSQRFAPLNHNQLAGMNNMYNFADAIDSPAGAMNASLRGIEKVAGGEMLGSNPYAGQVNPWQNQSAVVSSNAYKGASPHADALKQQGLQDVIDAYERGTSRDLKGQAVLSGAFGGSAHQNALANNQAALGKTLGNLSHQYDQSQYDRSAQLEESAINRSVQNQQFDKQLGGTWYEGLLGRGASSYDSDANRMMQAMGLGQNENQNTLARIAGLMDTGAVGQAHNQKFADFAYQNWADQQNSPFKNIDFLTNILGRSMGSGGMSTSMYGGNNMTGNILGGLLGAYAMS